MQQHLHACHEAGILHGIQPSSGRPAECVLQQRAGRA
jgi:hypothetical protein